jgi:hypothetical protein
MAHITLYPPNETPQEFDVKDYRIQEDGVLWFRVEGSGSLPMTTQIRTTVPFLIKEEVPQKEAATGRSTCAEPARAL